MHTQQTPTELPDPHQAETTTRCKNGMQYPDIIARSAN